MNLLIINRLKKQFNNNEVFKNYLSIIILLTYCYFWISIGKIVEINVNEFLNNGLIYLIIFSACLFILINKLIINRKLPILSILIIYPVASSIGYFNNINLHQNFDTLIHFFFTTSALFIFFSILEDRKDKKKLFKYFFKISSIFISLIFIILVLPDVANKIINNIHIRETNFITINLFFFDYTFIQNSNGAARVTCLIFIFFFNKFIFKIKKNKKYKKYFFLSVLFSIIVFYFQSRLSIIFMTIYVLSWILTFSNKSFFLKIIFFVSIIFVPFIFQNIYNSHLDIKKQELLVIKKQELLVIKKQEEIKEMGKIITSSLESAQARLVKAREKNDILAEINVQKEITKLIKEKKQISKIKIVKKIKENIYVLKNNNRILDLGSHLGYVDYVNNVQKCNYVINYRILEIVNIYSSGRICGWEILLRDIDKKDIIFGKGFFYDQKFLYKQQKISSNSYINIIYNSGLFGLFPLLFIFMIIISKYQVIYNLYKKSDYDDFLLFNLMFFLLIRSFFEDTFAFVSIDSILFLTCYVILSSKLKEFQNNKN